MDEESRRQRAGRPGRRSAARAWLAVPLAALAAACAPEAPTSVQRAADPAPGVPRDLAASPGGSDQIDLEWQPPATDSPGVASYRVYRNGRAVAEPERPVYTDAGLEGHTAYEYRVSALAEGGVEGERSDSVLARTLDGSPPGEPPRLEAESGGSSSVELAWDAATDTESGVSAYRIYRDGSRIAESPDTTYVDTGLESSTTYRYEVSAVNGEGLEGDRAGPSAATTDDEDWWTPPSRPSELEAEAEGSTSVELEWEPASDAESGIAGYRVYRDDERVAEISETSYEDEGLEPSTTYRYEVSAVNGLGMEGDRAGPAPATTDEDGDG